MDEVWKAVVGFEGLYEVSDHGRVHSSRTGRILKPRWLTNTSGNRYARVNLCRDTATREFYIHALLLEAFVGPRPIDFEAAHLDGDSTRNVLDNLEWKTPQGNADDRVRHGTSTKGSTNPHASLTEGCIVRIRDFLRMGLSQSQVAAWFGVRQQAICKINRRQRWAHV